MTDAGAAGDGGPSVEREGDAVTSENADAGNDGPGPPGADQSDAPDHATSEDATYRGLVGSIPYAFRVTDSRLLRSYVVVGSLLAALVAALFVQALVVLLGRTIGVAGGSFTFSRTFFVVVALAVVAPLLAPIVSTARRHRHGYGDRRTDRTMAALGYLFVAALYVALVISAPPELRDPVGGPLAPIVETLYGLPWYAGLLGPSLVALATWLRHRRARPGRRRE